MADGPIEKEAIEQSKAETARELGKRAHMSGLPLSRNPFRVKVLAKCWDEGWRESETRA